jgi:hypothetical protein
MNGRSSERKPYTRFNTPDSKSKGSNVGKNAAIRRSAMPDLTGCRKSYAERVVDQYNYWSQKPVDELDYRHGKINAGAVLSQIFRDMDDEEREGLLALEDNGKGKIEKAYINLIDNKIRAMSGDKPQRYKDGFRDACLTRMEKEEKAFNDRQANKEQKANINNKRKRDEDSYEAVAIEQPKLKRQNISISAANTMVNIPMSAILAEAEPNAFPGIIVETVLLAPAQAKPLPPPPPLIFWQGSTFFHVQQQPTVELKKTSSPASGLQKPPQL